MVLNFFLVIVFLIHISNNIIHTRVVGSPGRTHRPRFDLFIRALYRVCTLNLCMFVFNFFSLFAMPYKSYNHINSRMYNCRMCAAASVLYIVHLCATIIRDDELPTLCYIPVRVYVQHHARSLQYYQCTIIYI